MRLAEGVLGVEPIVIRFKQPVIVHSIQLLNSVHSSEWPPLGTTHQHIGMPALQHSSTLTHQHSSTPAHQHTGTPNSHADGPQAVEVVAKTMEYSPAMSVTGVVQNPGGDSIKLELHSLPLVTVSLHCSATLPDDVEAGLLTVVHCLTCYHLSASCYLSSGAADFHVACSFCQ